MPYTIKAKDGTIVKDVPDNVDPNSEQAKALVEMARARRGSETPSAPEAPARKRTSNVFRASDVTEDTALPMAEPERAAPQETPQAPEMSLTDFLGTPELVAMLASGAVAEPIAGLRGIVEAIRQGSPEAGTAAIEETRDILTFRPSTEAGQKSAAQLGLGVAPIVEDVSGVVSAVADPVAEELGPEAGTVVATAPAAIAEWLGFRKLKGISAGTRLLDAEGNPTRVLRRKLDESGLTYKGLQPEVKEAIPQFAEPDTFEFRAKGAIDRAGEDIVVKQIEAGGNEAGLAGLKVIDGKLEADDLANRAIKQGFEPGLVQTIKTSNTSTRKQMGEMVNTLKEIRKDAKKATTQRATDSVGEPLAKRINFIKNKVREAARELDGIANKKFKGMEVDSKPVFDDFQSDLDSLRVGVEVDENGASRLNFDASDISEDKASQGALEAAFRLLTKRADLDANELHRLKRQFDKMINFRKRIEGGLGADGEAILMNVRTSINDVLRDLDKGYAKVNDTLSDSLTTLDDLDKATGSTKISGETAATGLGTELRALISNRKSRPQLLQALKRMDETLGKLGGKFDEDLHSLVVFADGLDDRFGTTAGASFAGQVAQGIKEGVRAQTVQEAALRVGGKILEKGRGISEFEAFESLESLLKGDK